MPLKVVFRCTTLNSNTPQIENINCIRSEIYLITFGNTHFPWDGIKQLSLRS